MASWQLAFVGAIIVLAFVFADPQLAAILAGVAAATTVMVVFHHRGRAQRKAIAPLAALLESELGPGEGEPGGRRLRWKTTAGGRSVSLGVEPRPDDRGRYVGCVTLRALVGPAFPFCFVAQRRAAALRLSPLVANAAVFDSSLECELSEVSTEGTVLERGWDLKSSSVGAMRALLEGPLRAALGRWLEGAEAEAAELAVFSFDGLAVSLLLVPHEHSVLRWLRPALGQAASLAATLGDGLRTLSSPPTSSEPPGAGA